MENTANYQPLERRKVYEQIAEQLLGQIGSRALNTVRASSESEDIHRGAEPGTFLTTNGLLHEEIRGRLLNAKSS